MRVMVNNIELDLLPGMTVRHALVKAGLLQKIASGNKVCDEWGNEVGLDGALFEGIQLTVGPSTERPPDSHGAAC